MKSFPFQSSASLPCVAEHTSSRSNNGPRWESARVASPPRANCRGRLAWVVCAVLILAGCAAEPGFQLNSAHLAVLERDFRQPLGERRREDLQRVLEDLFGTPDEPRIPGVVSEAGVRFDLERLAAAAGAVASDEQGVARGLYRAHCVNCHGITGDGVGPAATFMNPYPRDFRRGVYKFKSTPKGEKPTDDDLRRILVAGIPGTAMPSYAALPDQDVVALVQYVRYLSIRGEVERLLADYAAAELGPDEPLIDEDAWEEKVQDQRRVIGEFVARVADAWARAPALVTPVSPPLPGTEPDEAVARGRALYFGDVAGCVKCHGESAEGDGQTTDYDDWTKEFDPGHKSVLAALSRGALWPRTIRPRNLRLGVYRGGGQPEDLYRRIHNGIDGTPMPAALVKPPDAPPEAKGLTPEDIWCLVDFVRSLAPQGAGGTQNE